MNFKVVKTVVLFYTLTLGWSMNTHATTPALSSSFVELMDVNADGYADAFVSATGTAGVGVMLGDGLGGFGNGIVDVYQVDGEISYLQLVGSREPLDTRNQLYIGYFNVNNYMDYWTSSSLSTQSPYINTGMPSSMPLVSFTKDVNGDTYADSIYNNGNQVVLALGNPDGTTFGAPQVLITNSQYLPLDVADANGDGNMDILFYADFNHFVIYYGDGVGGFSAGSTAIGQAKRFMDINHDVYADIVSVYQDAYVVDKYEFIIGDAVQSFSNRVQSLIESNYTTSLSVADLNVDTYADLVVGEQGFVSAYLGDGAGSFVRGHSYDVQGKLPIAPILATCSDSMAVGCDTPVPSCLSMNTPWGLLGAGLFALVLFSFKPKRLNA